MTLGKGMEVEDKGKKYFLVFLFRFTFPRTGRSFSLVFEVSSCLLGIVFVLTILLVSSSSSSRSSSSFSFPIYSSRIFHFLSFPLPQKSSSQDCVSTFTISRAWWC